MKENTLYATNRQKVLSFLLDHPDKVFYDREISRLSGVSRAGTNFALRDIYKEGLIKREKRGRMYFYSIDIANPLIKQLKITQNITRLSNLLEKLKPFSLKVILYGSAAKGTNTQESDLDLFILTREKNEIKKIIFESSLREKIQYVSQTPNEYARSKEENPVFHKEISEGIILWDQK